MISDIGRSKRVARESSSASTVAKWRALKSPVFASTRASACSCGTASERWISSTGAIANGISQGLNFQKAATPSPRAARTKSVERLSNEKIPVLRSVWPRPRLSSMGASRPWFSAT